MQSVQLNHSEQFYLINAEKINNKDFYTNLVEISANIPTLYISFKDCAMVSQAII